MEQNQVNPVLELLKTQLDYHREKDVFYLRDGSEGYGEEVFKKNTGTVSIRIPGCSMAELVRHTLDEGKGRLEIETDIEDRLGSPGYPDYLWWESAVKQYTGKAILLMEIIGDTKIILRITRPLSTSMEQAVTIGVCK